ncbi:hypothetical protein LCGC14_2037470 [marine sediment metagenome]|uniref:HNH nuclease domain-containing protein n=1 Tax=marine sediment metagenome TaxID=412755 RepID=A0A0F9HPY2_9ZZZZ
MAIVTMSTRERFFSHVEKTDRCWLWTAYKDKDGYGVFHFVRRRQGIRKRLRAHRWSYEHHFGPIPKGYLIDHICRTSACVRPTHLRVVTPRENTILNSHSWQAHNAAKTHCKRGHPLTGANVRIHHRKDRPGCIERHCRKCGAARVRALRAARG